MLQLFAMLVSSVSSTLQMTRRRLAAECHSDVTPAGLPRETSDTLKEPKAVPQAGTLTTVSHTSPSPPSRLLRKRSTSPCYAWGGNATKGNCLHQCEALGEVDRCEASRRRGHNESVNLVHASPAKAGVQSQTKAREAHQIPSRKVWTPAFAGDAC